MGCTGSKSQTVVDEVSHNTVNNNSMASRRPPSAGSSRPVAPRRASMDREKKQKSAKDGAGDEDLVYECKAAFLVIFDDLEDDISNVSELSKVLQQAGRSPTKKMLNKYWKSTTESLSFDDFCDICRKEPATTEDDLMKAFKKVDINSDGYITNNELKRMLTTKGEKMTTEEVQEIIDEVDENGDGKLDYKEFCNLLLNTQNEAKKMAIQHMERKAKKKSSSSKKPDPSPRTGRSRESVEEEDSGTPVESDLEERKSDDSSHADDDNKEDSAAEAGSDAPADTDAASVAEEEKKEESPPPPKTEEEKKKSEEDEDDDDDSDDDIIIGSSRTSVGSKPPLPRGTLTPPKPKPRSKSKSDSTEPPQKPAPRGVKEWTKPSLASKDLKLPRPKKLKDWQLAHSKGCFFIEVDGTISNHQYQLELSEDTSVWITLEPFSLRPGGDLNSAREVGSAPIDTMLFILRQDNSLVTLTEHRDPKGKYGVRCDLEAGTYKLLPFSTGCRFKRRKSEPNVETKLVRKKGDGYVLTKQFREALSDVFEMCDLDGNGMLSRNEFNFFNMRTSGEEVQDSEWDVVEENVELKNGELTRNGFIQLNEMEAADTQGDTSDLWVTLNCMGFNKGLQIDEACPFFMEIYSEDCAPELTVTTLAAAGKHIETAIVEATVGKGEQSSIKGMKDLFLHSYVTDFRTCLVVENKSKSKVHINIDCNKSRNCVSNRRHLDHSLELPSRTSKIAHHLMPEKETAEWSIRCVEILE